MKKKTDLRTDNNNYSKILKDIKVAGKLRKTKLATLLFIERNTLDRWINGTNPPVQKLYRERILELAAKYKVSVSKMTYPEYKGNDIKNYILDGDYKPEPYGARAVKKKGAK